MTIGGRFLRVGLARSDAEQSEWDLVYMLLQYLPELIANRVLTSFASG